MSDKRLTVKDLSDDQRDVYDSIVSWTTSNPSGLLTVGGLAGSGKSTLIGVFAVNTNLHVAYATFTGRAASVLQRKLKAANIATTSVLSEDLQGKTPVASKRLPVCTTIHSLLYKPVIHTETDELLGWTTRESLKEKFDLICIDEASMVSDEIFHDLERFDIPILAVGDHGQLPPVMASGDLMQNPVLRLEKIHRQSLGNPIIELAHTIRNEGRFDEGLHGDRIRFLPKGQTMGVIADAYRGLPPERLGDVGVLCWTNKNRVQLNGLARKARGISGAPAKGEQVICLRNKPPVFNGMRGILTEDSKIGDRPWKIEARIDYIDESILGSITEMCAPQFNRDRPYMSVLELHDRGINVKSMKEAGDLFDFGYALTVHRSQGSSFTHAILYVDRGFRSDDEEARRFFYTAATRASERLTVLR
jgi:exodeoxyribonuclease V